ncbi:MAG: DUF1844 domain-containing protein [Candidatus Marinimicrobia bacterium]|nr:DUF1844 domain-containing protein [Candidatus Neomarinimicrobiota bacterium]
MTASKKIDPNDLFTVLVTQLSSSAWSQLGVNPNPLTGKKLKNLEAAEMTIGILEALLFKTAGNLNKREDKLLAGLVRELKSALVKVDGTAKSN